MSHGSKIWPARKENELALARVEIRMFRWTCGVCQIDSYSSIALRDGSSLKEDSVTIVSLLWWNMLRWYYRHVLRKDEDESLRRCLAYEVEGTRPRGRPETTWKEVAESDLKCMHLHTSDAIDRENKRNWYEVNNLTVTMKAETVGDVYFQLIWCRLTQVDHEEMPLNELVIFCTTAASDSLLHEYQTDTYLAQTVRMLYITEQKKTVNN